MVKKFLRTSLIIAGIGCLLTSGISNGSATEDSEPKYKPGRPAIVRNEFGIAWNTQVTTSGVRVPTAPCDYEYEGGYGGIPLQDSKKIEKKPTDLRTSSEKGKK